eukprot:Ihof_evm2s38 gene=Ihof_evmTU2s38
MVLEGLTVEETESLLESSKPQVFQAEVNRMMKLIINSLYKNRDIFLRELISNASDALDKIRFLSLTNNKVLGENQELSIRISADIENGVLTIEDSGIGMTKANLESNLGTIAHSGTAEFMSALEGGDANSLIGQFGVGFYSVFLVADTVVVTSKHNDDEQYIWESDASTYKIIKDPRSDNKLARGTRISLYLKKEARNFLEERSLKELIGHYSEFINFPIYLEVSKQVTPEEEEKDEDLAEDEKKEKDDSAELKPETVKEFQLINTVKPLWTRSPKDITEEEYKEFYKAGFKQMQDPLTYTHFEAEGEISFKALMYVPMSGARDMLQSYNTAKAELKLFVRKVFITADLGDVLPKYLLFIKGIIDSDDLPLNVSRETLQHNKLLILIKRRVVKKILEMLKKMSETDEESYTKFWTEFGSFIKLGTTEDKVNHGKLMKLLRFKSSASNLTSLDAYVERMKEGQTSIYFMPGLTEAEVVTSPLIEKLNKKGYEVLYFTEAVDEYLATQLREFDGHNLVNVAKSDLKIKTGAKEKKYMKTLAKKFTVLTEWLPKLLPNKISRVTVSNRLEKSPCALVAEDWGVSGAFAKYLKAQNVKRNNEKDTIADVKPQMDINPRHPLIQKLQAMLDNIPEEDRLADPAITDLALTLHDMAALKSGFEISDVHSFGDRLERMMRRAADVPVDAE